jgi:hypothetical protein
MQKLRLLLWSFWLILFTLLIVQSVAFAQKENYAWHFGNGAGLDFRTLPPTPIVNSSLNTNEGSASIANRWTGETLFYTDGTRVWNRNNVLMPNGFGLDGDASSTQSGTIVPMPGDSMKFYLFTSDQGGYSGPNKGICYSIVDMSLDGGLGDVTTKNISVLKPATEKLTAIPNCNGSDFWILMHAWSSNAFVAYQVTKTGVNPSPVVSRIGTVHTGNYENTIGYLVASPNGQKIADCIYGDLGILELFDFDNQTGIVSNFISLPTRQTYYGLSFSPDNTKLYASMWIFPGTAIYQYDLTSNDQLTISISEYVFPETVALGCIRPGPEGKLYVARVGSNYLGTISNPNGSGALAIYEPNGISIAPGASTGGLPNIVDAFYKSRFTHENARVALMAADSTHSITLNAGDTSEVQLQILDSVRAAYDLTTTDIELSYNDNVMTDISCASVNGWSVTSKTDVFGKTKIRISQPTNTAIPKGVIVLKVKYRTTVGDSDHTMLRLSSVKFNALDPSFESCTFGSLTVDSGVVVHVNSICGDPTIRNYLNRVPLLSTVSVFPNPSSDGEFITRYNLTERTPLQLRVSDAMGRTVLLSTIAPGNIGEQQTPFNLRGNADGLYFITFEANGGSTTTKAILRR